MRRSGMILAIGLLVLVNAVVLGGASYNRSGEGDGTVTLTERELPLGSYSGYSDRENTGLSLRLSWSRGTTWHGTGAVGKATRDRQAEWFDQAKLEAVGFDCRVPLNDPRAALHYDKLLSRKTFAVLEYEGKAWEAWQAEERDSLARMEGMMAKGEVSQKQLADARKEHERDMRTRSRLFAVDVGNDPRMLRQQYGDRARFLILPATVRLSYHRPDEDAGGRASPPYLEGSVDEILTESIYVPKEHRALLEKLLRQGRQAEGDYSPYAERRRAPAYAVKLRIGKRHEPWVVGVLPLAAEAVR